MNNISEDTAAVDKTEPKMNTEVKNLLGQKFNRLIVTRFSGVDHKSHALWECLCDCGKTKVIKASSMVRGMTKSCGCMLAECHTARKGQRTGLRNRVLYKMWSAMVNRCHNPKRPNYVYYGARGISVCNEWRTSFEQFESDIGPRPTAIHSIDRIDVNGNYEPTNCRWATPTEQGRNRRSNRFLEFNGERLTISEWANRLGVTVRTISCRIESGWVAQDIFTTGTNRKNKKPLG